MTVMVLYRDRESLHSYDALFQDSDKIIATA